mmetsp:Transcript_19197/g.27998  ORF Transcript_19197/g.27998 Transcript_19197/m.27998 type:complete len:333 (-) Transcript_19197:631-1629(-)
MGSNLVCDNSSLYVITVGKTEMFLGSYVAEHGSSKGGDVGSTNCGGNVIVTGCDISSEWSEGVEGCLVTPFELIAHVHGNLVEGNVTRPFVHDLDVLLPRTQGELSLSFELGKLRFIVGIPDGSGAESITDGKGDIVLGADVEDFVPMLVGKVFLVVEDVPLGMDGSTTGDDTSLTIDGHRYVTEKESGVDGKVVHSLLRLLNESLSEDLPIQVFGDSIDLLKSLVNGNGSNGDGRIPHDPLTRLDNVLTSTQIHESIGTPEGTPLQFLNLLLDRGRNGRVSNIGINLDLEHTSNDLRLELLMKLVAANDGTAPGNFRPDEFRLDVLTLGDV